MVFNTGAALLDAVVLAVVSREQEGTYGYKITQEQIHQIIKDITACMQEKTVVKQAIGGWLLLRLTSLTTCAM